MAVYRVLIECTNRGGRFGADNRRNPLWGLMFQHQWQMRTRDARDRVLPLLDAVFSPRRDNRPEQIRLLGYLLRP